MVVVVFLMMFFLDCSSLFMISLLWFLVVVFIGVLVVGFIVYLLVYKNGVFIFWLVFIGIGFLMLV